MNTMLHHARPGAHALAIASLLGLFSISCASAEPQSQAARLAGGNRAVLESETLMAEIADGTIARLRNKLTSEEYVGGGAAAATDAQWAGGQRLAPGAAGASVETVLADPNAIRIVIAGEEGKSRLETLMRVEPGTGDLLITQKASGERAGLESVGFGLAGLDRSRADLMVPHESGRLLEWRYVGKELRLEWPLIWEIQFALLQGPEGGVMIRAEDVQRCAFKHLVIGRDGEGFSVSFRTVSPAPFDQRKDLDSVAWRVTPYRGNWQKAAAIYRRWAEEAYGIVPIHRRTDWVKDVRFLVICNLEPAILPELASWAPPASTLLYLPNWRRDGYDRNYPEYSTVLDDFPPFFEAARRMGFRVMLHVNYFGCDPLNPLYEQFKKSHIVLGGQPQWWLWPPDPKTADIRFAYINPADSAWRRLLVERFSQLRKRFQVDALHLDQTLCIFNDENGLIDGLNCAQGNILLHEELLRDIPGLVYSGEGLNEVTFRREAFAQRHVHGINHAEGTWDDEQVDLAHPLCSAVMRPYTLIYGYLGMANPADAGLWRAWKRAYENWGVIPTYPWPSLDQLRNPTADVKTLKREVRLWAEQQIVPDFDTPWPPGTRFMYSAKDGGKVVCRDAQGGGTETVWLRPGMAPQRIERRFRGRSTLPLTEGAIADWPAYSDTESIGLDPAVTYLVEDGPYPAGRLRLTALPDGATIARCRINNKVAAFNFEPIAGGTVYDFVSNVQQARRGILRDGVESELDDGASFEPTTESGPGGMIRGIFAHPPWRGRPGTMVKGRGETFGEYCLKMPNEPVELTFFTGIRKTAAETDGVTFAVSLNGAETFRHHQPKGEWTEHRLDLSALSGKEVVVRFVTGPGEAGDVSWDWAVWGAPRLVSKKARGGAVEVFSPRKIRAAASGGMIDTAPAVQERGGMYACKVNCVAPGGVVFILADAQSVALPLDLAAAPREVSISNGYVSGKPYGYASVAPGTGICGGAERRGLCIHPPNGGRIYCDCLIRLPAGSVPVLSFACGVADGSKEGDLEFIVEANGVEIWKKRMKGPSGWHDAAIDLAPFAGKPVLLSIAVDSRGSWGYDWARIAEPVIRDARK